MNTKAAWATRKLATIHQAMQVADREPARDWRGRQRKARVMAALRASESRVRRFLPPEPDDDLPF